MSQKWHNLYSAENSKRLEFKTMENKFVTIWELVILPLIWIKRIRQQNLQCCSNICRNLAKTEEKMQKSILISRHSVEKKSLALTQKSIALEPKRIGLEWKSVAL